MISTSLYTIVKIHWTLDICAFYEVYETSIKNNLKLKIWQLTASFWISLWTFCFQVPKSSCLLKLISWSKNNPIHWITHIYLFRNNHALYWKWKKYGDKVMSQQKSKENFSKIWGNTNVCVHLVFIWSIYLIHTL